MKISFPYPGRIVKIIYTEQNKDILIEGFYIPENTYLSKANENIKNIASRYGIVEKYDAEKDDYLLENGWFQLTEFGEFYGIRRLNNIKYWKNKVYEY